MNRPTTYTALDLSLLNRLVAINNTVASADHKPGNYRSPLDYTLTNGMFFQSIPLNFNTLVWVGNIIKSIENNIVKGNVYTNAMALCLADSTNKIDYHEGFVYTKHELLPHAWCVLEGRVIDLDPNDHTDRIIGTFKESSYFGVKLAKADVRANYLKQVALPKNDYRQGILNYNEEEILNQVKPPQHYNAAGTGS